jgi:hypothetical protein
MDDETKSVVTKLVDKFSDVVANVTAAASSVAQHAMEANARRMEPDSGQIAGTANEQVYIPQTNDAAAIPAPLIPVAPKKAKKTRKKAAGRNFASKSSKRAKKAKPSAGRKAVAKKNARKAAKKKKAKRA